MKVLIVDDSAVMRRIIIRELKALEISTDDIMEAGDGAECLQMVQTHPFDIILMDWNMPNMLGIDAVKAIRAKGIKTAILMITTESERSNVITAIQAGANNYLAKPFTSDDFAVKFKQVTSVPA